MIVIFYIIGGAAFVYFSILDLKERLTHKRTNRYVNRKKSIKSLEIDIDDELKAYEITFRSLCGKAGVYRCRFLFDDSAEKDIYSFQEKSEPPCIVLTRGFIEGLKRDIPKSEMREGSFKFVIAHELAHIRYDDNINLSWRMTICGLLFLGGMFVCLCLGTPLFSATKTGAIVLVLVIVLWLLMFFTFCNPNYWSQVQEFRADRFALKISEEPPTVFNEYMVHNRNEEILRRHSVGEIVKQMLLDFLFPSDNNIGNMTHPSLKKRSKELARGKEWGFMEYIRYGFQMLINMISGKGVRL